MKKIKIETFLKLLKVLVILWSFETLLATIFYSIATFFSNGSILFIIYINIIRFIYYYWILMLIYFFTKKIDVLFLTITNTIMFVIISIFLSFLIRGAKDLFLDISFFCNLVSVLISPFLLKKIKLWLPPFLNIYGNPSVSTDN